MSNLEKLRKPPSSEEYPREKRLIGSLFRSSFNEALTHLSPKDVNPYSHSNLAYCLAKTGMTSDALFFVEQYPDPMIKSFCLNEIASVLTEDGRTKEASELISQGITNARMLTDKSRQMEILCRLANSLSKNKETKRSLKLFNLASSLAENQFEMRDIAHYMVIAGFFMEAQDLMKKVDDFFLSSYPSPEIWGEIAKHYLETGDLETAQQIIDKKIKNYQIGFPLQVKIIAKMDSEGQDTREICRQIFTWAKNKITRRFTWFSVEERDYFSYLLSESANVLFAPFAKAGCDLMEIYRLFLDRTRTMKIEDQPTILAYVAKGITSLQQANIPSEDIWGIKPFELLEEAAKKAREIPSSRCRSDHLKEIGLVAHELGLESYPYILDSLESLLAFRGKDEKEGETNSYAVIEACTILEEIAKAGICPKFEFLNLLNNASLKQKDGKRFRWYNLEKIMEIISLSEFKFEKLEDLSQETL